ncbi:hypothetical protein E1B28_011706 [Marasmius oreades]|uniref:F-box protein n=1 Tax=Marasmius oreades TaxID=181124 RepID=A0A9P7RUP2_9AGAR|nr:uncharacterized protein E1B28_011706 [Marasmius oreades]KAG7090089.1 hypothetical protein E1B28_011706 [Marasmius oreades]
MVREWLKRSKNCPLTLSLEMIEDLDSEPEEWEATISATNKILRTVVKHLHRWKTVFFSFSNFPIQSDSPLLHLPPSPTAAPVLERVDVCESKSFTTVEDSKKFWQAIASYPSVRHVMWIDDQTVESSKSVLPNLLPPSSPESSWTNLTRLATRFIVDESLMEFLSGCKGLEVLHVTGLEQSDSTSTLLPRPRVCLPSLKKLEFGAGACRGSVSVALGTLLDTLDLPMLETLELEEWACPKAWMELIQRSESRVKRISVAVDGNALLSLSLDDNTDGSEGDVDVQSILVSLAMRHLEELGVSLFCPGATDRDSLFLRGVSLKQGLGALPSPSMRRLRLEIDDFQLEGEVLEGMVRSCVDSELEDTRCAVSVDVVRRRPM